MRDDKTQLDDYRISIDNLDNSFMFLIAERLRITTKIISLKNDFQHKLSQSPHRLEDIRRTISLAEELGLNGEFVSSLLKLFFQESQSVTNSTPQTGPEAENLPTEDETILDDYRKSLFLLDSSLCYLLTQRFRLVEKIGLFKKKHKLEPLAPDRWQKIMESKTNMARDLGIRTGFITSVMESIHKEALRLEA